MKKQEDITVVHESEPLIASNTSIQHEEYLSNTQVEQPKANEPSMLTLAREGLNGYTAAQISTTVLVAGTGIMVINSLVHSLTTSNSADDAQYNTTLEWLSGVAGVLATTVTSYGYLRTEAWRLRLKARVEDIQNKVSVPQNEPPEDVRISNLEGERDDATARAVRAELRATTAEAELASLRQLKK